MSIDPAPKPVPIYYRRTSLGQFALRVIIAGVAVVITTSIATNLIVARLDEMIDRRIDQIHVGGRQFWSQIERELDRTANAPGALSPEKKNKILTDLRRISDKWRGVAVEGWAAVVGEPPAAASGAARP